MNSVLQQFYNDIQAWIETEFPNHEVFKEDSGLCVTLRRYLLSRGESCVHTHPAYVEMESQFILEGFNKNLPFNKGDGAVSYLQEHKCKSMYKNRLRLAWIRRHANSSIGLRG